MMPKMLKTVTTGLTAGPAQRSQSPLHAAPAAPRTSGRLAAGLRRLAPMVGATAVVALSAHVSIPLGFTPVPLTLQPFAVLLLGLLLGPREGFAAMVLYLLEGAAGLPVFSPHGPGGVAQILGPTGGYLLAAPAAACLAGAIHRVAGRGLAAALAGAAAGDLALLAGGAAWLGLLSHAGLPTLLRESVLPFLLTDAAKVAAAAVCARCFAAFGSRPR
jgi:biotin transport system substrate-specific component